MPCNSEHMEPTYVEIQSKKVCLNIHFLFSKIGRPIPEWVEIGANDYYGCSSRLTEAEYILYNCIKTLNDNEFNAYVYNARCKKSRSLANWYEDFDIKFKDK